LPQGSVNGITNVIDYQTGSAFANDWWYMAIKTIGWGLFAFLPVFVGMYAAKEFKGSPILGGIGGIFCLSLGLPTFPLASLAISMPFTNKPYVTGVGGLLTALFMGIFIALTERWIRTWMPNIFDTFFTPILTLIFCCLISVVFLQPVGNWLTNIIYVVLDFLYTKLSWIGGYLLSSTFLGLVSVGLHQALTPIHDEPFLLLDEATSAIDSNATSAIIGDLLDTDKTVLMIAHNFSPELKEKFDYQIHLQSNKKKGNSDDN